MFLSTFISNSTGTQIHHPTAQASFWIHFPFSIKNPIQTQSPVSSLTASSCSPPPEAHVHAHTHTHLLHPIRQPYMGLLHILSHLVCVLSTRWFTILLSLQFRPSTPIWPSTAQSQIKGALVQLSHFHRSGLGTVPLGIGCMDSRDNSQKQSLVEASAES